MLTFESATKNLCQVALDKLNSLLLHPDARVLKAASEAIVFLLKFQLTNNLSGKQVVE